MLTHVHRHVEELTNRFWDIADDLHFQYLQRQSYSQAYKPTEENWVNREAISLHNGEIVGYMRYSIDRDGDNVYSLQIVNFTKKLNPVFAKDLSRFLRDIFEKYKYRKLKFSCVRDNPVYDTYERLCKRMGGRVVGVQYQEDRLLDGEFHDAVLFEVLRDNYMMARYLAKERSYETILSHY